MDHRIRTLRSVLAGFVVMALTVALAACGSSGGSGSANSLLRQTFTGSHKITSGDLSFNLTITPSGSKTLTGPISLSFSGPFQSLGAGRLPESAFDVSLGALGNSISVTITSTGKKGYVTFEGSSYQLPSSTFQQLESSFARLGATPGSSGSGVLGKLGIQPAHWLKNPQVVGTESVGGASTTHIHSGIDVAALLNDFNTFLQRASSLGVSGAASFPHGISAATRQRIAGEVQNPSFDLWTGQSDKTVRKLAIGLTLPVSGGTSLALGGMRSASFGLSMQYSDLNRPQTIAVPRKLLPFSQFQTKLKALISGIKGGLGSTLGGSSGSTPGGSGSSGTTGSGAALQAYSQCINAANGDVAKMQRCAPLLGSQ